jgi:flagellin
MSVLNTNISSRLGANALKSIVPDQALAMERLSKGKRINSAADDAAGLAVKERELAKVNVLNRAAKNVMDGISMLELVEGKAKSIGDYLQRMRELAIQSATGTNTPSDRLALDLEFEGLWNQIQQDVVQPTAEDRWLWIGIGADNTFGTSNRRETWMKVVGDDQITDVNPLLSGAHNLWMRFKNFDLRGTFEQTAQMETDVRAFSGGTGQSKNFAINPFIPFPGTDIGNAYVNTGKTSAYGSAVLYVGNGAAEADVTNSRIDIKTANNAKFSIDQLDTAINGISDERARYASYLARFQFHYDNLLNRAMHHDISQSRIEDANYALETKNLSKTKILSEASTAILAQANQTKDVFLSLLERDDYIF